MSTINIETNSKEKRMQDIVLGVVLAMIGGFLVNIISSIFYDVFIIQEIRFSSIHQWVINTVALLIILFDALLRFLIYDVPNTSNMNKSFWKRYALYFQDKHWTAKVSRTTGVLFKIFLKWVFWIFWVLALVSEGSWAGASIVICLTVIYQCVKKGAFRKARR